MKVFKTVVFILMISSLLHAKISVKQDSRNFDYLQFLDENLTGTIEVLSTFNSTLDKLPADIKGVNAFSQFLMSLTMECSNLKKEIATSYQLSFTEREELIRVLISSLNPEIKWFPFEISREQDEQNQQIAQIMQGRFREQISHLRQQIFKEEAGILEAKTFYKYFFYLHSQHFMYKLMMDFLEPSENLSRENRDYLIKMVRAIEDDLMNEKPPKGD
jgi:hypothetical protein